MITGDKLSDLIIRNEGVRDRVYADSLGIPTVGVGFNLKRADARDRLAQIGADYDAVLSGQARLSAKQIQDLLSLDIADARKGAERLIPNFSSLSETRQHALVDLVFNMGETKFAQFKNTIAAINRGDFAQAARQLERSKWYSQVAIRGPRIVSMIEKG